MTRPVTISRRSVTGWLTGLASIALAIGWPSRLGAHALPSGDRANAVDAAVARLLPHRDSARAVGRAYLDLVPDEASLARLRALLGTAVEAMAARVRADYAQGRVMMIDGWTLSLTELRACALRALAEAR